MGYRIIYSFDTKTEWDTGLFTVLIQKTEWDTGLFTVLIQNTEWDTGLFTVLIRRQNGIQDYLQF